MPPKSTNTGREKLIDDEEEVLQAVILADSFNKRFRPLTARRPRCLLPICNAPLLDWTFENLALAGVQEIFVVCRSFADQIKVAIKESRWSKPGSGIKIVPILTAKETFSPGDAMRDIYTRGVLTSDFVLVMGDLVSNIRIDDVVRVHKERRKANKDAIMTMVVKESGVTHRTKSRGESSVFVLDSQTSECLHYEPVVGYPPMDVVQIPREILASHRDIEIRNDLIDCSIDVCSVEVPSLFQDNFDYLDIRKDFVHGVLTSDLLMKSIHCYVAEDGYAARVKDTKSYDAISKDILSRWTFPLVPDDNHPGGHIYEHVRGNKYIAKDVTLARTCKIGNNSLIGSSTQVHENVLVIASVIGPNCVIGAGSTVQNAYIFDGTVIGANCTVNRSIIGAGVSIKDNSRVEKGCLIGDGVIVGPSASLGPFERLSKKRDASIEGDADDNEEDESEDESENEEDLDSDLEEVEANQNSHQAFLGQDSNALVWPNGPPTNDDEEEELNSYKNERFMRLGDSASDLDFSDAGSISSDSESESDEDDSDSDAESRSITAASDTSASLELPRTGIPMTSESEFRAEVTQSLERAFAEGHSVDNAAVELKTLRMASNVPLTRVREAVVAAIVEKVQIVEGGGAPQRKEIANVIGRWGELINKIGGVDAVETITALQTYCVSSVRMPLFGQVLAALYQDDIIEEEDIRKWHALPTSKGEGQKPSSVTDNIKKCWMIGAQMIKQFDEQDSEEEDEEEEEEEEEGDADSSGSEKSSAEESTSDDNEIEDRETQQILPALVKSDAMTNPVIPEDDTDDGDEESEDEDSEDTRPQTQAANAITAEHSNITSPLLKSEDNKGNDNRHIDSASPVPSRAETLGPNIIQSDVDKANAQETPTEGSASHVEKSQVSIVKSEPPGIGTLASSKEIAKEKTQESGSDGGEDDNDGGNSDEDEEDSEADDESEESEESEDGI